METHGDSAVKEAYSHKTDDELLRLTADERSLTDEAREVLRQELRSRQLEARIPQRAEVPPRTPQTARWLSTPASARRTAWWGAGAAFFASITTGFLAALSMAGISPYQWLKGSAFVDAFLFALLGIGIVKMYRSAAVAALLLYLLETAWKIDVAGPKLFSARQIFWVLFFVAAFSVGIVGTFAYRRVQ